MQEQSMSEWKRKLSANMYHPLNAKFYVFLSILISNWEQMVCKRVPVLFMFSFSILSHE